MLTWQRGWHCWGTPLLAQQGRWSLPPAPHLSTWIKDDMTVIWPWYELMDYFIYHPPCSCPPRTQRPAAWSEWRWRRSCTAADLTTKYNVFLTSNYFWKYSFNILSFWLDVAIATCTGWKLYTRILQDIDMFNGTLWHTALIYTSLAIRVEAIQWFHSLQLIWPSKVWSKQNFSASTSMIDL